MDGLRLPGRGEKIREVVCSFVRRCRYMEYGPGERQRRRVEGAPAGAGAARQAHRGAPAGERQAERGLGTHYPRPRPVEAAQRTPREAARRRPAGRPPTGRALRQGPAAGPRRASRPTTRLLGRARARRVAAPTLRTVADLDVEAAYDGVHRREIFLILRGHAGHFDGAAAGGTRLGDAGRMGLVDPRRTPAASLPPVPCTGGVSLLQGVAPELHQSPRQPLPKTAGRPPQESLGPGGPGGPAGRPRRP